MHEFWKDATTMANDSRKVSLGKPLVIGGLWIAPLGTALPTNETTALNAAFKGAGYLTADGVSESVERSIEKIKGWGGNTIAVPQSDFEATFEFSFAESHNTIVLKAVYGDANVAVTPATSSAGTKHAVSVNAKQLPKGSYVFELGDGTTKSRIVVPNGQLTPSGETSYVDDDIVAYPATIDCLEDTSGNVMYKYLDDGVFSA